MTLPESKFIADTRKKFKKDKKILDDYEEELTQLDLLKEKKKSDYIRIAELYKNIEEKIEQVREDKRNFKSAKKVKYVKRDAVKKIIAAWIITVPTAALLSAAIFFMIKGIMT